MPEVVKRPELSPEWIEARVAEGRIFGIACQTLKVIPTAVQRREDNPTTFDVTISFPLQTEPYNEDKNPLSPEDDFRQAVEAAVNAEERPLGYKVGKIKVVKPERHPALEKV